MRARLCGTSIVCEGLLALKGLVRPVALGTTGARAVGDTLGARPYRLRTSGTNEFGAAAASAAARSEGFGGAPLAGGRPVSARCHSGRGGSSIGGEPSGRLGVAQRME